MPSAARRVAILRGVGGLAAGWATSAAVLAAGFALLRLLWADYALAEPEKAYTLAMLLARLVIFSSMIAATAAVAALVAGDERFAWIAGALILLVSIPPHLYPGHVWDDYPVWYHVVYLVSILPIAVAGGRWSRRRFPRVLRVAPLPESGAESDVARRARSGLG